MAQKQEFLKGKDMSRIYVITSSGSKGEGEAKRDFANKEVCRVLKEKGYSYTNADLCVAELAKHLRQDAKFPHEIGLFLGYPVKDVLGFMNSPEEGVKYTGFWKVYGDKESALKIFDKYKRVTEIYSMAHKNGKSLEQLAVATGA